MSRLVEVPSITEGVPNLLLDSSFDRLKILLACHVHPVFLVLDNRHVEVLP